MASPADRGPEDRDNVVLHPAEGHGFQRADGLVVLDELSEAGANRLVSLADVPSSQILAKFAKDRLKAGGTGRAAESPLRRT
jgi:hypothetical protein